MSEPASSGGLSAEEARLYALVHDGSPGDVAFYRQLSAGARDVLELGCGDARVSAELARDGLRVVGLERDAGMRARAARRLADLPAAVRDRVRLVAQDMRAFDLGRRFDRVYVPFTGLYCLLSEADLDACLRSARAHLAPGGLLAFDAYCADGFHDSCRPEDYPDDMLEEVARIGAAERELTVYERSTWDREAQRMDATYVYVDPEDEVVCELEVPHRYLRSGQVEPALRRAGLELLGMYGSFGDASASAARRGWIPSGGASSSSEPSAEPTSEPTTQAAPDAGGAAAFDPETAGSLVVLARPASRWQRGAP